MILPSGCCEEDLLAVGIGRQPFFLQRADDRESQRIAGAGDHADRFVGIRKIVVGEFGDGVLERTRKRRHGEGRDQED